MIIDVHFVIWAFTKRTSVVKLDAELFPTICMQLVVLLCYILALLLYRGIEFILVTLLKIPLYRYLNFLWLRGGHDVINRVVSTETYQPSCMVKVND